MNVQQIIDVSFNFQCCLSDKLNELIEKSKTQQSCSKEFTKLQEYMLYFKVLKNELFRIKNEDTLVKETELNKIVNSLKVYCKECCL